ncbi:MAG TPA: tetratricopeptide repeat protein, partial [Pyrinomonadaceae bacterium]|nr:tetratricopeptide repeat protein [Pyrinomonadaceae bacterium]
MIYRNRIGALALATALLIVPFTPSVNTIVWAHMAQQEDVPSDAEQALFTKGQNLYLQGHYEQAITVLRDFLRTYPNSIITDLTLLWLGRSYMQMGRWQDAEGVSQRLHTIHDTPFADVYDSELQTARREAASRPAPSTSSTPTQSEVRNRTVNSNAAARTNQPSQNSNVRQPQAVASPHPATAAARPTPTPSRPALNINRSTQPLQNSNGAVARNNPPAARPSPTPRVIASATSPGSEIAPPAPETSPQRVPRYTPRRRGRRQTASPNSITGTQATALANANTRPQQVAVNTVPRTTTPVQRPTPSATSEPLTIEPSTSAQAGAGANFTVRQVPGLMLALRSNSESAYPGQSVQIPMTVTNTGNKEDQFSIETDLPAEYQPSFSLAQGGADTGLPILVTPQLARNASIDVILNLRVPEIAADGQQRRFFIRATSQSDYRVLKVADGAINVIAAALSAISDVSQSSVMPGDTFTQTISVRNNGTAPARNARADFVFNPNFELVNAN